MSQPPLTDDAEHNALYCPECGYDVRFTSAERCPECGVSFTRSELAKSRIPWVHRARIGRFKAFVQTLLFGIGVPSRLAAEVTHPVSWRDANRFRWCVVLTATLLSLLVSLSLYHWVDFKSFHEDYNEWSGMGGVTGEPPLSPLAYPFWALWTGPALIAVIAVSVFTTSLAVSWWLRCCFWTFGGAHRDRLSAISLYTFAWWLPVAASVGGILCVGMTRGHLEPSLGLETFVLIAAGFVLFTIGMWMIRGLGLLRKVNRSGPWKLALAGCTMLPGILVISVACPIIVNYGMGLAAIIFSSFQR
jgi:hypothetical protein